MLCAEDGIIHLLYSKSDNSTATINKSRILVVRHSSILVLRRIKEFNIFFAHKFLHILLGEDMSGKQCMYRRQPEATVPV